MFVITLCKSNYLYVCNFIINCNVNVMLTFAITTTHVLLFLLFDKNPVLRVGVIYKYGGMQMTDIAYRCGGRVYQPCPRTMVR